MGLIQDPLPPSPLTPSLIVDRIRWFRKVLGTGWIFCMVPSVTYSFHLSGFSNI